MRVKDEGKKQLPGNRLDFNQVGVRSDSREVVTSPDQEADIHIHTGYISSLTSFQTHYRPTRSHSMTEMKTHKTNVKFSLQQLNLSNTTAQLSTFINEVNKPTLCSVLKPLTFLHRLNTGVREHYNVH